MRWNRHNVNLSRNLIIETMEENCTPCQDCIENLTPVMPPQTANEVCPGANPCSEFTLASCTMYSGSNILCGTDVVVPTGATVAEALNSTVAYFCQKFDTLTVTENISCDATVVVQEGATIQEALEAIVAAICAIDPQQGPAGINAYKFVHEEVSNLDGDVITITRQALEYCNMLPPACSTDAGFIDKVCDLHVKVYYLVGGAWTNIPAKPFGIAGTEGYRLSINSTTGDMAITLSIAPIDPGVPVRVVILA